jgi:hypothetical protein
MDRVLLEKLTVADLIMKFSLFYGTELEGSSQ